MTLSGALQDIRSKIDKFGDDLDNEEITKDVLIRPMIRALGYDSSDPTQVKAEFSVAMPKGGRGRADYVIFHNGKPAIVMECKALGVQLDQRVQNQMLQYARSLHAFAGIVTDGNTYYCFANAEDQDRIDGRWYHALDLSKPQEDDERALSMLSKERLFRKQLCAEAASLLTSIDQEGLLLEVLNDPTLSEEIFRIAGVQDSSQRREELTTMIESLTGMIQLAVDRIASGEAEIPAVVTTNDELDAYLLCKGILHGVIEPHRVEFRDSKTYASVLIDDNNRKPVCRFHFNGRQMFLGTFDEDKNETRHTIDGVNDIIDHANSLRRTARRHAES